MPKPLVLLIAAVVGMIPTAASAALDTAVTVPVGEWIGVLADVLGLGLAGLAIFVLRMLPGPIYRFLMMLRAEQLIARAVDYGLQSVAGAARGRTLTVDLGNAVLAEATRYAVEAADDLVRWLGGADQVRRKILARLDLEPAAVARFGEDGRFVGVEKGATPRG